MGANRFPSSLLSKAQSIYPNMAVIYVLNTTMTVYLKSPYGFAITKIFLPPSLNCHLFEV